MKFHLISLGCQMNISDSERLITVLKNMGFEETNNEDEADLIGVMACSVRQKAIDKIYSLIHKWEIRKKKKSLITFISGCILPADREKFLKRFDLLFSINELPKLPDLLRQYGMNTAFSVNESSKIISSSRNNNSESIKSSLPHNDEDIARGFWQVTPSYSSNYDAFVTIQNGCDKFCTFCAVPYTRGREVSRASSEILQEIYALMQNGYKSITLLGQNVNSYGLDTNGTELTFAQLLERIGNMANELQHDCWVYFTSPHPRDMTRDVLETIARYPTLAKQIHLPLQSGDDKLLIRMNRNHSMAKYRQIMNDIREILPNATVFTDIIVGFCGESKDQFKNTISAMQEFEYNMAYIAMYSPRPGAASHRWHDDIPMDIKKQRFHTLSKVLINTAKKYNLTLVGKRIKVLVEKIILPTEKNTVLKLSGRNEGKIPVQVKLVNGLLSNPELETFLNNVIGNYINVVVVNIHNLSLECELETISPLNIYNTTNKISSIANATTEYSTKLTHNYKEQII